MPQNPSPFPWWLWLLAGLWAATVVIWQRGLLPRDWHRGLSIVATVYTVLLAATAIPSRGWPLSRLLFWLAAAAALAAGFLLLQAKGLFRRRASLWLMACGVAGVLVSLNAEIVAAAVLVAAGLIIWRMEDPAAAVEFAIPQRDAWLVSALLTLVLVGWIGGARYAVNVELHRPGPSYWFTALPSREQVRRWTPHRATTPKAQLAAQAGLLGLALIVAASAWFCPPCERTSA